MSEHSIYSPDQQWQAPSQEAVTPSRSLDTVIGEELERRAARTTELTGKGSAILLGETPVVSNYVLEGKLGIQAPGVEVMAAIGHTQNPSTHSYLFKRHGEDNTADLLVVPGQSVADGLARRDSTIDWPALLEAEGTKVEGTEPGKGRNFKANGQPFRRQDAADEKAYTVYADGSRVMVRNRSPYYSTSVTYNRKAEII